MTSSPTPPPRTTPPSPPPPRTPRPVELLHAARSVVFIHAHPDDETLAIGGLILALADAGVEVRVLTATRGERGDVVPGPLSPLAGTAALEVERGRELAGALAALAVRRHDYLGMPPARVPHAPHRIYRDSGMRWVAPGLAGPADEEDAASLVGADVADVSADIAAYLTATAPDVVVTYDEAGGYGHPDHVRVHEAVSRATAATGVPLVVLVSASLVEGATKGDTGLADAAGAAKGDVGPAEAAGDVGQADAAGADVDWWDLPQLLDRTAAALRWHASQVTVVGSDVIHSGGQREPIVTRFGLRTPR